MTISDVGLWELHLRGVRPAETIVLP